MLHEMKTGVEGILTFTCSLGLVGLDEPYAL